MQMTPAKILNTIKITYPQIASPGKYSLLFDLIIISFIITCSHFYLDKDYESKNLTDWSTFSGGRYNT